MFDSLRIRHGVLVVCSLVVSCSSPPAGSDAGVTAADGGAASCAWPGTIRQWTGVAATTSDGTLVGLDLSATRTYGCLSKPPTSRTEALSLAIGEGSSSWVQLEPRVDGFAVGNVSADWTTNAGGGLIVEGPDAVRRRPTELEAKRLAAVTDAEGRLWTAVGGQTPKVTVFDAAGVELATGSAPPGFTALFAAGSGVVVLQLGLSPLELISSRLTVDLVGKTVSAVELKRRPWDETVQGVLWRRTVVQDHTAMGLKLLRGIPVSRSGTSGSVTTTFIELLDPETLSPTWTSQALTSVKGSGVSVSGLRETSQHLAVFLQAPLPLNSGAQKVNGVAASTYASSSTSGAATRSTSGFLVLLSRSTGAVALVAPDFEGKFGVAEVPGGGVYVPTRVGGITALDRYGADLKKQGPPPPDVRSPGFDCDTQSFAALPDLQASSQCMSACVYCVEKYLPDAKTGAPRTPAEVAKLQEAVAGSCAVLDGLGAGLQAKCAFCPTTNPLCAGGSP